jgi:thiamine transporter ThiT
MKKSSVLRLVYAALCLALGMVLPLVTGGIPQIGQALSPMHLPVIICGFICGPWYGLIVGAISPLLRFAIFGMPPLMPVGIAMAFELAAYGLVSGILYHVMKKNILNIYINLVITMIIGRIIGGIANSIVLGVMGKGALTFSSFIAAYFVGTLPGIIVQLILIPIIVIALQKAKLIEN